MGADSFRPHKVHIHALREQPKPDGVETAVVESVSAPPRDDAIMLMTRSMARPTGRGYRRSPQFSQYDIAFGRRFRSRQLAVLRHRRRVRLPMPVSRAPRPRASRKSRLSMSTSTKAGRPLSAPSRVGGVRRKSAERVRATQLHMHWSPRYGLHSSWTGKRCRDAAMRKGR